MKRRRPDLVVLSDLHLGTYGCRAEELCDYLNSIDPRVLILNGDIIDIWRFRKHYFPESHLGVIRRLLEMMNDGTDLHYLTGNHDEQLRYFSDLHNGRFRLADKLILNLDGKRVWIFHGDIFDITRRYSKWVARLGSGGYDLLMLANRLVNRASMGLFGRKFSLSRRIKESVKSSMRFISGFEHTAAELAIENGYDYVICGHIHRPAMREVKTPDGKVTYLNSGDWIEHLTALEYHRKEWRLYRHHEDGGVSDSNGYVVAAGSRQNPEEELYGTGFARDSITEIQSEQMVDLNTERIR